MKKVELHAKTKYSLDYDSIIDIEALLWNAKENGEKGIVIADKDSIMAFPKIEKIYHRLCAKDKTFKDFKIGYGVQITVLLEKVESEIVLLVKNQSGLKNLYKIMSLYNSIFKNKIPLSEVLNYKSGLLIGLILNNDNKNLNLDLFNYIEINVMTDISNIDTNKIIVFSNHPNTFFQGDLKALEILYFRKRIEKIPECRLYLNTEETLKICNDKKFVITNSNLIFDKLEQIVINDEKIHITHSDDFDKFASLVKTKFEIKFKNPSSKIKERLDKELKLVSEMDYTYYFKILMDITVFCRENKAYYQLDGYINNSLIAYILDITEIEPFHLPYELFFSETIKIMLRISPKFYNGKLHTYINKKFDSKLIKCSYRYKFRNITVLSTIKRYEEVTGSLLNIEEKDYMCHLLNQTPLSKCACTESYFLIPNDMEIEDFTPYEIDKRNKENNLKYTHFEYSDLNNNLIKMQLILDSDIEFISNMRNITQSKIEFCNQKQVYDSFRSMEPFHTSFKILDRTTGLLNIKYFDTKEVEIRLKNTPNLWLDDLMKVITKKDNSIIMDDLYNELKERNLDEMDIFQVSNYLESATASIVSRATLMNKVRVSYMQMYYKLNYASIYYKEVLAHLNLEFINKKIFMYDIEQLKEKYFELKRKDRLWMAIEEHQELRLLEIIFEMYERKINFKLEKGKVVVK